MLSYKGGGAARLCCMIKTLPHPAAMPLDDALPGSGQLVFEPCSRRSKRAFLSTNRVILTAALPLLALAACADETPPGDPQPAGTVIECAVNGATEFTPDCTMERDEREGQPLLIVRHPDGGFHRLELGVEGQGIVAADGADKAVVTPGDGMVEVTVGPDRYRLAMAE